MIFKNETNYISEIDKSEIKSKFQSLWKDIFKDDEKYISLLFDTYFDKSLYELCFADGKKGDLISGLLAIPYEFYYEDNCFKSLYLCGLSTRENWRGKGIMKTMIESVCQRGKELGYAMVFLIPASEALRRYYHFIGFTNGIGRVAERYVSSHDFYRQYANSITPVDEEERMKKLAEFRIRKVEFPESFDETLIGECRHFIARNRPEKTISIVQNALDIKTIFDECLISGGFIGLVKNSESGQISALATVNIFEQEMVIPHLWADSDLSKLVLLDAIMTRRPECSLLVWNSPGGTVPDQLKDYYFAQPEPDSFSENQIGEKMTVENNAERVVPYSMIRILSVSEILKFLGNSSNHQKFSILVKIPDFESHILSPIIFRYEDGKIFEEPVDDKEEENAVTLAQLQEILFEPQNSEAADILNLPHANMTAFDLLD